MAPRSNRSLQPLSRSLKTDQRMKIRPIGARHGVSDIYHAMLRASWPTLFALFCLSFIAFNLLFAILYWYNSTGISWGERPIEGTHFWRAFVFSVDTMATVGYGNMVPISRFANVVATIEIALGILFVALVTGVAFARFSRPTARIMFSTVAVVTPFEGVPTLMFRCANQRRNLIFEATASMSLIADQDTDGRRMRRFHDMKLVRATNPVFALTWTIMHPIDDDSPLKDWLSDHDRADNGDMVIVVSGTDDRTGHTMYGRWAYGGRDLRWNARFADILGQSDDGTTIIDYRQFNEIIPIEREADRPRQSASVAAT